MNGLEQIISDILSRADTDAANVLGGARTKAAEDAEALLSAGEREALEAVANAQEGCEAVKKRAHSTAALETRKTLLEARRNAIDETLVRVAEKLKSLDDDAYAALLASVALSDEKGGQLVFSKRDKRLAAAVLKRLDSRYTLSGDVCDLPSGFVLVREKVRTTCSVEALVDGMRKELEPVINKKLFED